MKGLKIMFICNININKNKLLKFFVTFIILVIILLVMLFIYYSVKKSSKTYIKDTVNFNEITEIPVANYTSILKDCNENIDKYIGKKIKFVGFVYRLYDFSDSQFVLAREMIIDTNSTNQAKVVVVGFLCEYNTTSSFSNDTWVEVEGTIEKGNYHSEIPIVKISNIKQVDAPADPYVYPPDGSYVPTENL